MTHGATARLRVEVVVRRGPIAESRHRFEVAVCGPDGALHAASAHPELVTTLRSAAKPFQLLPLVERGHAERYGFDDEMLAVMAASHTGSAYHRALVSRILDSLGCTPDDLACGFHEPFDPDAQAELREHPERRSTLFHNCSGKHSGMLALALAEGWPTRGYERADHPLQQLMRRSVAEMSGLPPEAVLVGVDGCSVSVFGMPLAGMARAYARLGAASGRDPREAALARIRDAMRAFPRATGGAGRLSTELMERTRGRLVAKGGAEGLECVALPERRLGIALKCEDGNARGLGPALVGILDQLGLLDPDAIRSLDEQRRPVIRNHAGLEVGALEAEVATPAAARA